MEYEMSLIAGSEESMDLAEDIKIEELLESPVLEPLLQDINAHFPDGLSLPPLEKRKRGRPRKHKVEETTKVTICPDVTSYGVPRRSRKLVKCLPLSMEGNRCLLCGRRSLPLQIVTNRTNELVLQEWTRSQASSLCQILDLDTPSYHQLFTEGLYCPTCFQILLHIDFNLSQIQALQRNIEKEKEKVVRRILSHYGPLAVLVNNPVENSETIQNPTDRMLIIARDLQSKTSEEFTPDYDYSDADSTSFERKLRSSSVSSGQTKFIAGNYSEEEDELEMMNEEDSKDLDYVEDHDFEKKYYDNPGTRAKRRPQKVKLKFFPGKSACSRCPGKAFSSRKQLMSHLGCHKRNHKSSFYDSFKCEVQGCTTRFKKRSEVTEHYAKEHPEEEPSRICDECGNKYFTVREIKNHMRTVHRKTVYNCSQCEKTFNTRTKWRNHEDTHNTSRDFTCPRCGRQFTTRKVLCQHKLLNCQHRTEELTPVLIRQCTKAAAKFTRPNTCKFCEITFPSPDELKIHEDLHIVQSPAISCVLIPCSSQPKLFPNLYELRRHMKEHNIRENRNEKKQFPCTVCDRVLSSEHRLQLHLDKQHNVNGKSKRRRNRTPATNHPVVWSVIPVRKFCESHCGLSFDSLYDLTVHRKAMGHYGIRSRTHCNICGEEFKLYHELKEHKQSHTNFICPTCGKAFKSNDALRRHSHIHEQIQYPCAKCGKLFPTKQYLGQHETLYCSNRPCDDAGVPIRKPKLYPRRPHAENKSQLDSTNEPATPPPESTYSLKLA